MTERIDKKIKFKKIKLIFVALILLLSVFFIVVTQTTIFNVKRITVRGNDEISKDKVVLSSGIVMGENIFKINMKNSKQNLLLHPYIKEIDINRKLPDKIEITIVEREEIFSILYLDSYVYVGLDGLVLDILKEKKENNTPIVEGLQIESPSIGSSIVYKKKSQEESDKITQFLEICSKKDLKKRTKIIKFNKNKGIELKLNSDADVAFGALNNIEYKMTFLIETLKDLEKKKIKVKAIHLNKGSDIIVEVVGS